MTFPALLLTTVLLHQSGPAPFKEQRYNWKNVEIVGGGFVTGILFHPGQKDLVYARTDIGGAYRWDPKPKRWIPLMDFLTRDDWSDYGIESMAVDPSDAKKLYLATGTYTNDWSGNGAIYRSNDQGRTFLKTALPFKNGANEDGRSIGERLAVDPNKGSTILFGTRNNGLWRSEDSGATWNADPRFPVTGRTNGAGIGFIIFDRYAGAHNRGTDVIYAGVARDKDSLYKTEDAGKTWRLIPGQPSGLIPHHFVLASNGTVYVTYSNGVGPNDVTAGAVWRYVPTKGEWSEITPVKPDDKDKFGYAGLAVDGDRPKTLMVSSLDRWGVGDDIWRSTDAGATWTSLKANSTRDSSLAPFLNGDRNRADLGHWIGDIEIDPFRSDRAMYVTGATIWGTENLTNLDAKKETAWSVYAGGLEETATIDLLSPLNGPHLISALGDIGGFRHDDLTVSPKNGIWSKPVMNNVDCIDVAEARLDYYVRSGRGAAVSAAFSRDGGTTWSPFLSQPPNAAPGSIAISSDGASIVWLPEKGKPCSTKDWGATWKVSENVPAGGRVISDRIMPGTFYVQVGKTLYISRDGGDTFNLGATIPLGDLRKVRAVPAQPGHLAIPTSKALYTSADYGATVQKMYDVQSVEAVGFGKAAPGRHETVLYIIGQLGGVRDLFKSEDNGDSWVRITDQQHRFGSMNTVAGDPRVYGRVYVGTNGRGILLGNP